MSRTSRWFGPALPVLGLAAILWSSGGVALAQQSGEVVPADQDQEQEEADGSGVDRPILDDSGEGMLPSPWETTVDRAPRPGDPIEIIFADGKTVEGEFVSQGAESVKVNIAGVTLELLPTDYRKITVRISAKEQYVQMRASIADDDVERLLALSQWLIKERLYEDARREIAHVLTVAPDDGDAIRLDRVIRRLIELRDKALDTAGPDGPEQERQRTDYGRPKPGEFPMLTQEQINLIKVYEIDLVDPPTVLISRDTITELLRVYADHALVPTTRQGREAFYRLEPIEILDVMFRLRARELYEQVEVKGDPKSIKLFRDNVHAGWLINSCATTRCHGGTHAGRFQLTNRKPTYEGSVYTNFLIIDRYVTDDGRKLIDYDVPARSPLLQLGLPLDDAAYPHPDVQGWRPVFRSRDVRRFKQAVEWIESMYRPRPVYPIEFEPPSPSEPPKKPEPGKPEELIER